ncbi:glutathione peroxidase [Ectothiorhodospiraceae bacterium BW-2]|nr:glutathione peroxidase [Ectothiorhodospiraceae bacterium BW-2]
MSHKEGQAVPQVTFKQICDGQLTDVSSDELFKGRTVVVFSLPGAYTPTCSSSHLPRYNELAAALHSNGVDEIVCLSVNDAFVMHAWGKDQQAENVTLLADGNGEFSDGMGMLVDKSALGFGKRSWRYSMLVKDGIVEKMFVEPNEPGDPFKVSDADTMLAYINPNADKPADIAIFTKPGCPFCAKAKEMLRERGKDFEEIVLGSDTSERAVRAITARNTVPQIFINGQHIGGSDDLANYLG